MKFETVVSYPVKSIDDIQSGEPLGMVHFVRDLGYQVRKEVDALSPRDSYFRYSPGVIQPPAHGPITTILAMGQSNMARGGFGLASYDTESDPSVQIWNESANEWQTWNLSAPVAQNGSFYAGASIPAFHFAKKFREEKGGIVRVIASAQGGIGIAEWNGGPGFSMYDLMVDQVAGSGTTKVDIILWQHGSANNNNYYATDLRNLITRVHALPWFPKTSLWISASDPRENYASISYTGHQAVGFDTSEWPFYRFASTASRAFVVGDVAHFTNDAIAEIGREDYWRAYAAGSDQGPIYLELDANQTSNTATLADVTKLNFQLLKGTYELTGLFAFNNSAAGCGSKIEVQFGQAVPAIWKMTAQPDSGTYAQWVSSWKASTDNIAVADPTGQFTTIELMAKIVVSDWAVINCRFGQATLDAGKSTVLMAGAYISARRLV